MAIIQIGYHARVANDQDPPNRIRELRERLNLSQAELARRIHVTPSALNKVEMGTRGLDLDWMRRIAPHLGVAPADLLLHRDNPTILSEEERELLAAYRRAPAREQDTFRRVAGAILPSDEKNQGRAA
jgi:transcriptional regulator with XRE-family HTH domain